MSRRGYVPEDEKQFTGKQIALLKKAADEVQFLLDQGYDIKSTTTFVGNHYMFSERQRLALARSVSPREWIEKRNGKELLQTGNGNLPQTVHIDGFNTVITLEVALSSSPVFLCRWGCHYFEPLYQLAEHYARNSKADRACLENSVIAGRSKLYIFQRR